MKDLGVDVLWLSPIQETNTNGEDVIEFMNTKPEFGLLDDFHGLINATKAMGELTLSHRKRE